MLMQEVRFRTFVCVILPCQKMSGLRLRHRRWNIFVSTLALRMLFRHPCCIEYNSNTCAVVSLFVSDYCFPYSPVSLGTTTAPFPRRVLISASIDRLLSIGINHPAIVREIPHFSLFPAFPHFLENVPHFWLYFEKQKIHENRDNSWRQKDFFV